MNIKMGKVKISLNLIKIFMLIKILYFMKYLEKNKKYTKSIGVSQISCSYILDKLFTDKWAIKNYGSHRYPFSRNYFSDV